MISSPKSRLRLPSLISKLSRLSMFLEYIWLAWSGMVARDIQRPEDTHVVAHHILARHGEGAIAPVRRHVDDHRPRLHVLYHLLGDQQRGGLAGIRRPW